MRDSVVRRRVVVHGDVQAVGFRWSARSEALRLGVSGFVRNLRDGSVELEAEGRAAAVDGMLAWAASGPPSAIVERTDVTAIEPTGGAGFEIRH